MARARVEMSAATKEMLKVLRPLTTTEERRATAAAVKHLSEELSQRYRVFPVELRIEKPPEANSAPRRATAVLVVDYERRRTTEVLVDAQAQPIGKTDLTGFQPAFLPEEIQEARALVERDERVAEAIRVRGAFATAFSPQSHEDQGARLVGLRYATLDARDGARLLGEAVVDLSRQEMISFADLRQEEGR